MHARAGLLVALLVVLAGCSFGFTGSPATDGGATETPEPSMTMTDSPDDSTAATPGSTPTAGSDGAADFSFADPPADRLGWEDGYWYNESLSVDTSDGLDEEERRVVVARAMARVEHIRELEFETRVPVEVITRAEYREQFAGGGANYTAAFRTFDNVKFEALFLIGESADSLAVQNENRGSNVLGFYSPRNESIVVIGDSADETHLLLDELTLGHELVHALQDQHFNLSRYERPTRETYNAVNGLIEGDARYVELRYRHRCEAGVWECVRPDPGAGGGGGGNQSGSSIHVGIYVLNYFPYSDGPGFVSYFREQRGDWAAVNALYDEPPASTEQVISPPKYGDDAPTDVTLVGSARDGWERIRPPSPRPNGTRPDYAVFGQSGIATMFAYTLYDPYNRSAVVPPTEFLNLDGRQVNRTDPFDYGFAAADGWDGDRMYVYTNPETGADETAYVWKTVWDDESEAAEFARNYRALLAHYGGERVGEHTWRIDSGPFADAFYLRVEGDTVVVVNAPTVEALGDVYAGVRR